MRISGVEIEDTFAEAFAMKASRVLITALDEKWALIAAKTVTGFATSVIGCNCEAGIDFTVPAEATPDGRPGVMVLFFFMSAKTADSHLLTRIGQAVMTSPTSACYDGLTADDPMISVGGRLRYFGDGFQASKLLEGRRIWRVPVMDGEFVVEEQFRLAGAVGGGNFMILAETQEAGLKAAEAAVEAMTQVEGVILPFPGGVVRSGSKVGSRYKGQFASTNTAYCPTLRGLVDSVLPPGVGAVFEIVVDGLDQEAVSRSMVLGIRAACRPGVARISAGNYGGKLGQYHFHLHKLLAERS